jgi:hypothetical protein
MQHDPMWVSDPSERQRFIEAYIRWVTTKAPQDQWTFAEIHDAIWHSVEPDLMLDLVIEIINRVASDSHALSYIAAGPLEDLLGGKDSVMRRAEGEARSNAAFRIALCTVYGVRYDEPGYGELHRLTSEERDKLP